MDSNTPEPAAPTPDEADDTADGLSAKHIRFCQLYFDTDNQSQSYIDAGFTAANVASAAVSANRLLKKPKIIAYLKHLRRVAAEAAQITVEELAALVGRFARADISRLMTPTGEFLPMNEWPEDVRVCVESVETEEVFEPDPDNPRTKRLKGHTRKVKLVSKMSAAARLMEWKRMTGQDKAADGKAAHTPLTVGGDASLDALK